MERSYEEALAEIDEILKMMPIDLLSKIPVKFRQMISENKAKDYKADIKEPLKESELKEETVIILGLIYRDFLASPEEREILQRKDVEELQRIEYELQQQYNMDNIFKKKKKTISEDSSTDLIVYKEEGFLKRIFNVIKGIFYKNKF